MNSQPAQHMTAVSCQISRLHKRSAQLVDGPGHSRAKDAQPKDPTQHVDASAADHQAGHDRDGEDQAQRCKVAEQCREAERRGLPVECKGHAEDVVGIPERK